MHLDQSFTNYCMFYCTARSAEEQQQRKAKNAELAKRAHRDFTTWTAKQLCSHNATYKLCFSLCTLEIAEPGSKKINLRSAREFANTINIADQPFLVSNSTRLRYLSTFVEENKQHLTGRRSIKDEDIKQHVEKILEEHPGIKADAVAFLGGKNHQDAKDSSLISESEIADNINHVHVADHIDDIEMGNLSISNNGADECEMYNDIDMEFQSRYAFGRSNISIDSRLLIHEIYTKYPTVFSGVEQYCSEAMSNQVLADQLLNLHLVHRITYTLFDIFVYIPCLSCIRSPK